LRYSRQHKQTARQHLVDRGGSHAKKHGFGGSGMDALAAAAGVTTGSLYRHFDGKSELFAAIVGNELEQSAERFSALAGEDRAAVLRMLDRYLSMSHVEHPERGCVLPTLTAEVARADEPVRAAFQGGIERIHAVLERVTGSGDDAWVLLAQLVGAVMLTRALPDEPARQRLLAAVRRSGRTIIESA
jgi:TetR/AcrR family transcriptional repressor of nem operon